jgi:excinuclease ABC subunit A
MSKSSVPTAIRLRGVRQNNLKNLDLDLPFKHLIVITGLSGSGKSSLAFDTLFAEGQRRYIETFSPYARQFFDRMDKPQADSIEGIPPAIAIEQRNSVRTTRSTVGTMTEICDHMKLLWPHLAQLHCRQCGRPVRKDSPLEVWNAECGVRNEEAMEENTSEKKPALHDQTLPYKTNHQQAEAGASRNSRELPTTTATRPASPPGLRTPHSALRTREVLITFSVPLTDKLSLSDSLALIAKQGYQRLLLNAEVVRLEEFATKAAGARLQALTVIQDRVKLTDPNRARFVEACEQAYHFGKGKLTIHPADSQPSTLNPQPYSNRLHCAACDIEYQPPTPALFSFNHPLGACPACKGFGRIISIDYDLALPDRSKTLAEGAVKPWQSGMSAECQTDLARSCRQHGVPMDVPFNQLPKKWQDFVIDGEPGYGKDEEHQWPRAWYGIKGYFRWLESKAYKMHVRVLLSRYRAYTPCPECRGKRFQPDALLYRCEPRQGSQLTLADFYQLSVRDALSCIESLAAKHSIRRNDPIGLVLNEVRARLGYLEEVGLGYLTLDRPTRTLSGGETERVSLTTSLGTRLVNTLFILDEPSVGLHPRDTDRLVRILERLRDAGNTVVVVEHEASVMRAADQIVDLGPGHGATGGNVVFQGSYREILKSKDSLTGRYLSGKQQIPVPQRRPVSFAAEKSPTPHLTLANASRHNLKDLTVEIPLGRFVAITGVSGSGKTTLVRELLLPALADALKSNSETLKASDRLGAEDASTDDADSDSDSDSTVRTPQSTLLQGAEHLRSVVLVDQSILAKTPRSNPAVYVGAFDDIREVFAQSELAERRGLNASAFSFNSSQGQCERCRGAGFEKIEMQFLSDIFVRCPGCDGRRYRSHILEVKISPSPAAASLSIGDLLDSTIEEAIAFLSGFTGSRHARRAAETLSLLQEVGLGYLKLGQPLNTLSGGESQRLKLVKHLAEATVTTRAQGLSVSKCSPQEVSQWVKKRKGRAAKTEAVAKTPQPAAHEPTPSATLFLFDEPTTGLHFDDVRVLLKVFQRLVDAGHSVLVIEHNLDVIKSADWVIDLGPEAGDRGGQLVACGTPEQVAATPGSHTGQALSHHLSHA